MANYYAMARSNYFRVKNVEDFRAACAENYLDCWTKGDDPNSSQCAISAGQDSDYGGWPSWRIDDAGNEIEIDMEDFIKKHIVPGDVCILQEVGYEKLRYLTAQMFAITSEGMQKWMGFQDTIKDWKEELGDFTDPEY